jgi:hypothetical protein
MPLGASVLEPTVVVPIRRSVSVVIDIVIGDAEVFRILIAVPIGKATEELAGIVTAPAASMQRPLSTRARV